MLRRALLVILALSLPFAAAGLRQPATAGSPFVQLDQLTGIPDNDASSGRFLTVSGIKNVGIPGGFAADPGQLILRIFFEETGASDEVEVALFDGDTAGLWDQRDDLPPVAPEKGLKSPFDTEYRLYADPDGAIAMTLAAGDSSTVIPDVPVAAADALGTKFLGTNAQRIALYSGTGHDGGMPGEPNAKGEDGRFSYTLRITLTPGPRGTLSGFEINGFKVLHNGRARLPEGTILGIIGGAVDMREGEGSAAGRLITEDPWLDFDNREGEGTTEEWRNYRNPDPLGPTTLRNTYSGEWAFAFDGQDVCELTLYEADADWNAPLQEGALWDAAPTGIPPDDGIPFLFRNPDTLRETIIDNSDFRVSLTGTTRHGLYWDILAPNGDIPFTSDDSPLTHPSYTGAQQVQWNTDNLTPAEALDAGAFQPTVLDPDEFRDPTRQSDTTPWYWRWHGVDARNAIWLRASGDFGTNGGRPITGRVFCELNGEPGYQEGEDTPYEGAVVVITPADGGADIERTTDTDGIWKAELKAGEYSLTLKDTGLRTRSQRALPIDFDACDEELDLDIPLTCLGSLSGRVYCDNNDDSTYEPAPVGPDKPLANIRVIISPKGGTVLQTTDTAADGTYKFEDLPAGEYTVAVDTTDPDLGGAKPLPLAAPVIIRDEIVVAGEETKDVDFRFLCPGSISGHVYRELWECNGKLDVGEEGIPGVTVRLETTAGVLLDTTTTNAAGYYEFRPVDPGTYDLVVPTSQDAVKRLKASFPEDARIDDVQVASFQDVEDQDFYFCPAALKVRVFKKAFGKACEKVIEQGDTPINGANVTVTDITDPNNPGPVYMGTTGDGTELDGEITFRNLDAGEYRVMVGGDVVVLLVPAGDSADQTTQLEAGKLTVVPSVWCEKPCSIDGRVVRKEDCISWWNARGIGIDGVWVDLRMGDDPNLTTAVIKSTQTTNGGFFEFDELLKGDYTVAVRPGQTDMGEPLEDLTATTPQIVYVEECPETLRFVYATAGVWAKVIIDMDCDGVSDVGIAGVGVTLEKLDAPKLGQTWLATTNAAGEVRFPTTGMNGLLPGEYSLTITSQPGLFPQDPLTQKVTLTLCDEEKVTWRFCGTGTIYGYVYKEIIDCNGEQIPGEPGVNGVTVELFDGAGQKLAETETAPNGSLDGFYIFRNLPRGTYTVVVDDGDPQLVDLKPSTPTSVTRQVIPPAEVRIDFGFCPTAKIYGYVFKQKGGQDCDGTYDIDVDEPISGIQVMLVRIIDPVLPPVYAFTDDDGYYEFPGLEPGRYIVSVSQAQPKLINLSPSTALSVGPFDLGPAEEKRIDFGFCEQSIHGTVFLEPEGNCDGVLDRRDVGIAGVEVKLTKIDEPGAGRSAYRTTNAAGQYSFIGIPAGEYEISIPLLPNGDPQPVLVGLEASSPQPLEPTLLPGQILTDQDFGYCPKPKLGKICGRVWLNPWDKDCDRTYDLGDRPLAGVVVTLSIPGFVGWRETTTDREGKYCFTDLPAGEYVVRQPGGEPVFVDLNPNSPQEVPVSLPAGGERTVDFP